MMKRFYGQIALLIVLLSALYLAIFVPESAGILLAISAIVVFYLVITSRKS